MKDTLVDMAAEQELVARAIRAYYVAGNKLGGSSDHPANDSGLVELNGLTYVVLRNVRGVLAVYRVRNDGMLKRLRRWPQELGE